jgi:hypothetical protein
MTQTGLGLLGKGSLILVPGFPGSNVLFITEVKELHFNGGRVGIEGSALWAIDLKILSN